MRISPHLVAPSGASSDAQMPRWGQHQLWLSHSSENLSIKLIKSLNRRPQIATKLRSSAGRCFRVRSKQPELAPPRRGTMMPADSSSNRQRLLGFASPTLSTAAAHLVDMAWRWQHFHKKCWGRSFLRRFFPPANLELKTENHCLERIQ